MNIKQFTQYFTIIASLCSLSLLTPKAALAHLIETDFQARFNQFELKATFSTGEAFPDAPVTVYSPDNPDEPLLVGRTDANGEFSFQPDTTKTGNWKVEIGNADDAHWDRLIVPVTKQGIDVEEISALPPQPEHQHDYFAYSFLLMVISLGLIFGLRKVNHRLDA